MKKLNKFFAVLVALAMMATLCVSMAFAAPAESSDSLADSVITKVLDVPAGVASPAASFDFTVTPTSQPSTMALTAKTETITFAAGTGTQTKVKSLADFIGLNDNTKDFNITQPGEYVFTVAEANTSSFTQDTDAKTTEAMDYSDAQYTLRVYVINGENGLEIKAITVVDSTVNEDPEEEGSEVDAAKVDPEDKDPTVTDPTNKEGSDFKFTNVYTKSFSDTEENGGAFNVEKAVTESGDTAFKFPITIAITIDEATLENGAYTLTAGDKTWSFSTGNLTATQTVDLANGEKAIFTTFPAGATVNVTENVAATSVQNAGDYTGAASGLATGTYAKGGALDVTTAAFDAQGQVKVTNTLSSEDITPTGILVNNLPYIALALVAIGGLVAYVVVRRRNADEA